MALRILFAGTPDFSVPPLKTLIESQHEVVAVLTQPDRPQGRGRKIQHSAVKAYALAHDIPVLQPVSLKDTQIQEALKKYQPDVMVVVAYGIILPQAVLDIPQYGCFNIHASLLPRWRGAAPIHRAIQAGDSHTGVSIMQMDAGLDTGDVLLEVKTAINPQDTMGALHDKLSEMGADALLSTLVLLEKNNLSPIPQPNDAVTYAHKITKAEAQIDWLQSTSDIYNMIRAFNPWPVTYANFDDTSYRIWEAEIGNANSNKPAGTIIDFCADHLEVATTDGSIKITKIQAPGKKAMSISDFFNAKHTIKISDCFS